MVAKLTNRLSVPKDYSKVAIAERKARLTSIDLGRQMAGQKLPTL